MHPRHKNNNKSKKINHEDDDDGVSKLNGSIGSLVTRSLTIYLF